MENIARVSEPVNCFLQSLPTKPYCTDDLTTGLRVLPAAIAAKKKYIQPNHPQYLRYLCFDLDYSGAVLAPGDLDLPQPSYSVENPANHHAHLLYQLSTPVSVGANCRPGPVGLARAVTGAMTDRLKGDRAFRGLITKNPLSPEWWTESTGKTYDLAQLAEYVEPELQQRKLLLFKPHGFRDKFAAQGRNCFAFEAGRMYAYKVMKRNPSHPELFAEVERVIRATSSNFAQPLPEKEIAAIARSIVGWCWKKGPDFFIGKRHRGRLSLPANMPQVDRQKAGARYTHSTRKARTAARIAAARAELVAAGNKPTVSAICRQLKIKRDTYYRALKK